MTPEEIHRALEYALRAGRQHGFVVDSASQTDEPSIAWAVPQVLADAGIKYFTNGSDPIRGALNPIGLLNFRSPFYWETPTGARLLVWSGVSYTAVDDMTWGGWNAESIAPAAYSPSIQGLTRSLPLFLSQYDRSDYAFDAVQLFGLHNDEIPMRHWGDADVIAQWNREYAFPKIIPAPQRDFFEYVTSHFGDRIETIRGDGGAYWEDEAGADARIAAMNRATQTQLAEAEMFESLAGWLQPHLRFDPRPFDDAWKHLLLADSYVWSDANSFRRPDSYRTREGEAAHRSYAETARQQAKDLRLAALDKVAGLVGAGRQGVVVFNSESRPRGGFFDFELESGEVLVDPAGAAVPCAAVRSLNGYHDVRCRAADVPALGYKFYATTGGRLAVGDWLPLDLAAPTVSGTHYTLTLDPSTGAIAHLIDRETGTDLVDRQAGYGLNEYLYVSGGDPGGFLPGSLKDNSLLAADLTLPRPVLAIHHAAALGPPEARRYPWGIVVTVRAKAENTPELISTITLPDAIKQVDIRNEVQKSTHPEERGGVFCLPIRVVAASGPVPRRDGMDRPAARHAAGREPAVVCHAGRGLARGRRKPHRVGCRGCATRHARRHQPRHLAHIAGARAGHDLLVRDEQLLVHRHARATGRPLHVPGPRSPAAPMSRSRKRRPWPLGNGRRSGRSVTTTWDGRPCWQRPAKGCCRRSPQASAS